MSNVRNNPVVIALVVVVTGMVLLAAAVTAAEAGASQLRDGHAHLVIQCPIIKGNANHCESFVIAAHPTPGELGEATARHRYRVETCTLFHGEAQDCTLAYTPVGGQIISARGAH